MKTVSNILRPVHSCRDVACRQRIIKNVQPIVSGLIGHRPDALPPLLPLPNWIDVRLMVIEEVGWQYLGVQETDQKTDVTRLAKTANYLSQCLQIQATEDVTRPLAELLAPLNLSNLPTDLILPVQETVLTLDTRSRQPQSQTKPHSDLPRAKCVP